MKQFYIGIDLGGSNIRAVACDTDSKGIGKINKKPFVRGSDVREEAEVNLISMIDQICLQKHKDGKHLGGIGVAMAALFDREDGVITKWPNNDKWNGFSIKNFLVERYKVPIVLEDDANAAALGEQLIGAGKGKDNLIYVTISTGIGCGIISNGSLVIGEHGWAGELGHIKVTEKTICTCGAEGCLQAVASGPAILKTFQMTSKYESCIKKQEIKLSDVAEFANGGSKEAIQVFKNAGRYIGVALANLVMVFDIPMIILGGGVMNIGELIMCPITYTVEAILKNRRSVSIVNSSLKDQSGVIGALALIDQYINKKT